MFDIKGLGISSNFRLQKYCLRFGLDSLELIMDEIMLLMLIANESSVNSDMKWLHMHEISISDCLDTISNNNECVSSFVSCVHSLRNLTASSSDMIQWCEGMKK